IRGTYFMTHSPSKTAKSAVPVPVGYEPRLKIAYRQVVVQEITKKFNLTNPWQVPRFKKIVVNMGVGQGKEDAKYFDQIKEDLSKLTGQLPCVRRAKKSIAGFKIREGQPIGLKVTL